MNEVIVITGQTATGKTSYALQLAKEQNGELVNFDSRQLYKYLNIITGKDIPPGCHFEPYLNEARNPCLPAGRAGRSISYTSIGYYTIDGIRLWLYDVIDPKFPFSSFDFKELAHVVIKDIISRKKIPIFVGGTYLYIKHLLYGFDTENIPPNWELRNELNVMSVADLQNKLMDLDRAQFDSMNNSDRQNPHRLIRKIEIASSKGLKQTPRVGLDLAFNLPIEKFIGFRYKEIDILTKIIRKRVGERLKMGAIEEVTSLLNQGYKSSDPGLNTIGYKEIVLYLEGKLTRQQMIERWILSEVQYAKRQFTFMKKDTNIVWKLI